MKVALVHDYLNEFGGAERVLMALSEIWPEAPIYTAFYKKGSYAWERFKDKEIHVSWAHYIPFFATKLHSPLRFLAPLIWGSFNFSEYDVVIGSAGWYITKGFKKGPKTVEICYCHTPPRWLYGYKTSIEFQKYWPVKVYAAIVGHFMRMYDFNAAQKVDYFIANSKNVAERIKKFYRRDSAVIYPPVELPAISKQQTANSKKNYYLMISRIVGGKGLDLAVKAAVKLGIKLKIAGKPSGYYTDYKRLERIGKGKVEFLGHVSDEELARLYAGAKAFLALAEDEDFGITPVEAMLAGTPVIAFKGGGYMESVVDGVTGILIDETNEETIGKAVRRLSSTKWDKKKLQTQARKFSREKFKREIKKFIQKTFSSRS